MAFWNRKRALVEQRSQISISNPVLADFFGINRSYAGVNVSESSALGLSAVWRAVCIITGTIAALPLRTLRTTDDDRRERVDSFLDNPAGPDSYTPFEWKELTLWHLVLHGSSYLLHVYNQAGALVGLNPIHPLAVNVEWNPDVPGGKEYTVTLIDGTTRTYDSTTLTQIMGPSLDGLRGLSPIAIARNSLGTAIAGDRSAARMFASGALIAGLVTPEEDITEDEAKELKASITAKVQGVENAGDIAFINRKLKFQPWTLSAEDAQFLQSRQFQIEEVARWFGIPPHLLMQTDKQTSWGTGVEEQNRGLRAFNLFGWTSRIEQRLSRLLSGKRFVEFDFAGLERPSPEQEIDLLIKQVDAGLLTPNEARRVRNLPPFDGGDVPRVGGTQPQEGAPDEP